MEKCQPWKSRSSSSTCLGGGVRMALGPGKFQSLGPALAVNTRCFQARCRESKAVTEDLPHVVTSPYPKPVPPCQSLIWPGLFYSGLPSLLWLHFSPSLTFFSLHHRVLWAFCLWRHAAQGARRNFWAAMDGLQLQVRLTSCKSQPSTILQSPQQLRGKKIPALFMSSEPISWEWLPCLWLGGNSRRLFRIKPGECLSSWLKLPHLPVPQTAQPAPSQAHPGMAGWRHTGAVHLMS